jgi:PAS domain S-box-containing protein
MYLKVNWNKLSKRFGGAMLKQGPLLSPEQLLRIADAMPAVVVVYDINTAQYLYVNKAVTAVMGYEPEELIAGGLGLVVSLVHPDDVQELLVKNQEALDMANLAMTEEDEAIATFEYRTMHKDGTYRWVKTDGTVFGRSPDGSVELILNVTMDISEQKRTGIRIRRGLELLERALDGSRTIEPDIEF